MHPGDAQATEVITAPVNEFIWSPDGKLLAYSGGTPQATQDLWVLAQGSTTPTRITTGSVGRAFLWSPTGDALLYMVESGPQAGVYTWSAERTVRLDGATGTQIEFFVAWSPDGKQVTVDQAVYNRAGNQVTALPGPESHVQVGWGPQGLFFHGDNPNDPDKPGLRLWLWDGTTARELDNDTSYSTLVVPQ